MRTTNASGRDSSGGAAAARRARTGALRASAGAFAVLCGLGCGPSPQLVLVVSPEEPAPQVASQIRSLLADVSGIAIQVRSGGGVRENLELLVSGEADLSIADDGGPFEPRISTLVPLYPGILHVLHDGRIEATQAGELIRDRRVYAGPAGGIARELLALVARDARLAEGDYGVAESPWEDDISVYFTVGGLLGAQSLRELPDFQLFGFDRPESIGHGSRVEALALRHPQLSPFVIPAGLYGELAPEPVVTVSIGSYLVARTDLDPELAYRISRTLLENRAYLRAMNPLLERGLHERFDPSRLNRPLHPGSRTYLERGEPGLLERYAESLTLGFTLLLAAGSGGIALRNWSRQRKKDRIDDYYAELLDIRRRSRRLHSPAEAQALLAAVQEKQDQAFELLMAEKLDANESFRIFVTLCQEVSREVEARIASLGSADAAP